MRIFCILFSIFLILTSPAFAHEETRELTLSVQDISTLKIDCGSGFLKVTNDGAGRNIEVKAEICVEKVSDRKAEELIEKSLELYLEKKGSKAVLYSHFENSSWFSLGRNVQAVVNLTVVVPENVDLEIEDGSGSIDIRNVTGNIELIDGSGSITLEDVHGDVNIEDGSGSIEVENITGNLDIDDGSGGIDIDEVTGNVHVDDNSGSMEIRHVGGNVTVDDGSGSITIDTVAQNVTIEDDGSGGLSINRVKGNVIRKDN